jgi:hypothetical protein
MSVLKKNLITDCVIGIDPGKQGGIAIYTKEDGMVRTVKMPEDVKELEALMSYYKENYPPVAFLEKLNLDRSDTDIPGKVFGIQKLLENFAQLRAVLDLSEIPYAMVHPLSWENRLGLRVRGLHEEKAQRKCRYRDVAAKAYPGNKVTLWNADALLIMHFGRYVLANDINWVIANIPSRMHDCLFEPK